MCESTGARYFASYGPILDHVKHDNPSIVPGTRITHVRPCNMWVAPNGNAYYVPECGHASTAPIIVRDVLRDDIDIDAETYLMGRGWLHLSIFYSEAYMVLQSKRETLTHAQSETVATMVDNMVPLPEYGTSHRYSWDTARRLAYECAAHAASMADQ